jgi:hypothetical protein
MSTFRLTQLVRASQRDVQDVLMDVGKWDAWLDGLDEWGQPSPGEVRGVWAGPIPVGFHFSVRPVDQGVRFVMVESDLPLVDLGCLWEPHQDGTTLTCTLTLEMGQTLPGPIWREIEAELMPRFLGAIEARLDQLSAA